MITRLRDSRFDSSTKEHSAVNTRPLRFFLHFSALAVWLLVKSRDSACCARRLCWNFLYQPGTVRAHLKMPIAIRAQTCLRSLVSVRKFSRNKLNRNDDRNKLKRIRRATVDTRGIIGYARHRRQRRQLRWLSFLSFNLRTRNLSIDRNRHDISFIGVAEIARVQLYRIHIVYTLPGSSCVMILPVRQAA